MERLRIRLDVSTRYTRVKSTCHVINGIKANCRSKICHISSGIVPLLEVADHGSAASPVKDHLVEGLEEDRAVDIPVVDGSVVVHDCNFVGDLVVDLGDNLVVEGHRFCSQLVGKAEEVDLVGSHPVVEVEDHDIRLEGHGNISKVDPGYILVEDEDHLVVDPVVGPVADRVYVLELDHGVLLMVIPMGDEHHQGLDQNPCISVVGEGDPADGEMACYHCCPVEPVAEQIFL